MLQEFHNLVNPKTKLISLVHVSNALGTILSTEEVVEAAQKVPSAATLSYLDLLAVHLHPSHTRVWVENAAPQHANLFALYLHLLLVGSLVQPQRSGQRLTPMLNACEAARSSFSDVMLLKHTASTDGVHRPD